MRARRDRVPDAGPSNAEPRPLLFVGNKRSGTSLTVNLLNLHPRILVAHEADLVWILYQLWQGRSLGELEAHPEDEGKGMRATLEHSREVLREFELRSADPREVGRAFRRVLSHINEEGRGDWDSAAGKRELRWVGDKKPVQHVDPELRDFLGRALPDVRFVHVVRNPRYAVASMREAAEEWGRQSVPDYWRGSEDDVAERWAEIERSVLELERDFASRLHTIRLEDLADRPVATLQRVFDFLDLRWPGGVEEQVRDWVWSPNTRHEPASFEATGELARLMDRYCYA